MVAKPQPQERQGQQPSGRSRATRASVSLPRDIYKTLQDIARQKKVSVAWVIRDAVEKYVTDQWPLFGTSRREGDK
jgi:predicted DNA-binding ribbon-helix-helix protein